ncbi:MAG: hypothetical protein K8S98_18245 [Planctomycetes bacterium]|nr:hypothetical protein [Planctomycetota bacterium]
MAELPTWVEGLFLAAVVWCLFWATAAARSRWFVGVLFVVGAVHWILAERGFYRDATSTPPTQSAWLAPVIVALLVTVVSSSGRRWLASLDPIALMLLHVLRVPVELVLHQAYRHDLVPRAMTFDGHNFDLASGTSAILMAAWMLSKRPPSRAVLVVWNVVCLGLLVNVVTTALLSLPSSVQRLNFEHPNVLVLSTPYVLLPALLVPAVLWAHVAALVRLLGSAGRDRVEP